MSSDTVGTKCNMSGMAPLPTILEAIIARKRVEVEALRQAVNADPTNPINAHLQALPTALHVKRETPFKDALLRGAEGSVAVIAEIKRKSPSKGALATISDPGALAQKYEIGGASAISCLTDEGFGGTLEDLRNVASAVKIPVIRKDFIIDAIQIAEAKVAGATAVLLIVAVLGDKTAVFLEKCEQIGVEAVVEVHDELEAKIAVDAGAELVGVNSRDLRTFVTDLVVAERLAPLVKRTGVVLIAESGIFTKEDVQRVKDAGYSAILVGEALVKASDPATLIGGLKS